MPSLARVRGSLLALALAFAPLIGCATSNASLDWRPGLRSADFEGRFEVSVGEYFDLSERGDKNLILDRYRATGRETAKQELEQIGARVSGSGATSSRGYGIVDVAADGAVALAEAGGERITGGIDWIAAGSLNQDFVALTTGSRLAVAIRGASTSIDLASLVGPELAPYKLSMVVEGDELTVILVPEIGGAPVVDQVGWVLGFLHQPSARRPWTISAARVVIVP